MAFLSFLQGLGATHLFTLSNEGTNTSDDYGNSSDPTRIGAGTYTFVSDPCCYGATHCLRSTNNASNSVDAARLDNRRDINNGSGGNNSSSFNYVSGKRTLMLWSRQLEIWNPTVIYEQGGGTNNFAFMGGAQTTFQAADAGQPFLIAAARTLAQASRNKLLIGVWEHHSEHSGSGNRILFYENGVLQEIVEDNGTANFPSHTGDATIGNSAESLRSFNGTTFQSQTVAKDANFLGMFNNVSLSEAQCRDIFERSVRPEIFIGPDTVANQQATLLALSGNIYEGVNCAIQIIQATDATDYTLDLDHIQFAQNSNLRDIAVSYVGPNTLTLTNLNGSNAVEVSTPAEVDVDGTLVYLGGGAINIVDFSVLTLIDLKVGTEVRIYDELGTELDGVESSGTSFSTEVDVDQVNIVIHALGFLNIRLGHVDTTGDVTLPIQQVLDRQYRND